MYCPLYDRGIGIPATILALLITVSRLHARALRGLGENRTPLPKGRGLQSRTSNPTSQPKPYEVFRVG